MYAAECTGKRAWYREMAADTMPYDVTCKACDVIWQGSLTAALCILSTREPPNK